MSALQAITQATFREEVVEAPGTVLVDFWAPWCGPCTKLHPILEELNEETGDDLKVVSVNVDEERTLAAMFQVMSIPNVLIYRDGKKVGEFQGVRSKSDIMAMIGTLS